MSITISDIKSLINEAREGEKDHTTAVANKAEAERQLKEIAEEVQDMAELPNDIKKKTDKYISEIIKTGGKLDPDTVSPLKDYADKLEEKVEQKYEEAKEILNKEDRR